VNGVLTTASWVDAVREQVGVTGISPVWDQVPAWYFWIARGPGAYQLQMERAWRDGPDDSGPCRGLFSVKCFPYRTAPIFRAFSFHERSIAESEHFDESSTPRFESRVLIPPALFVVGTLEITGDPDDRWTVLSLECLDLMRTTYREAAVEDCDLIGRSHSYAAGDVAREVPGWSLSFELFDRLVSMFSFRRQHGPSRVTLLQSPGFEYSFTGAHGWRQVEDSPARLLCLHVVFSDHADPTDGLSRVIPNDLDLRTREVIVDFAPPCTCAARAPSGFPGSPYVNPLWWSIAHVDHKSDLTSLCGCS
jgi:hypothetical protein